MKMEDLKFPLFETTEEEKDVLCKAKELITTDNFYLCYILGDMNQHKLITKVHESFHGPRFRPGVLCVCLDYLNHSPEFDFWNWYDADTDNEVLARKVWIDKLLAYNG